MESLKKNSDFKNCYNNGKSYVNRLLVMYVCGGRPEKNRFGISVSKKVGNSVVRHHVTRLIRESVRLHEKELDTGYDVVIVARVRAGEADFFKIESAFLKLAKKVVIRRSNSKNDEKNND